MNNWSKAEIEKWTAEELRILPIDEKVERSQAIIKAAIEEFQPQIGFAMSFGKDSTAIAHLIRSIYGGIPVPALFTDTRLKFPETYGFRDRLVQEWGMKVILVQPEIPYEVCMDCRLWKVEAARETPAKLGWQAIMVGIRYDEHEARAKETYFSPRPDGVTRVHPILHWTEKDIWEYTKSRNVPYNPLYDKGYRSIGCMPCTEPSTEEGPERGGRGQDKEKIMERLRGWGYW